jgi:hypothetical protein
MAAAARRIYAAPVVMDCFIALPHSNLKGVANERPVRRDVLGDDIATYEGR